MKLVLLAASLVLLCQLGSVLASQSLSASAYASSFLGFVRRHGKAYSSAEYLQKYETYKKNLDFVRNFDGTFEVALNEFADLSQEEFFAMYLGMTDRVPAERTGKAKTGLWRAPPVLGLPTELDWRVNGSVTPVKDQGQCGSCWSFSATGALEGCHALKTGQLVSLSEQNLVDCSSSFGNMACNGGLMTSAFDYVIKNNGIVTEESYPYVSGKSGSAGKCKFAKENVAATMTAYTNVEEGDENDLQAKMAVGPVSVAIDASHISFQFYRSGVYNEPKCDPQDLDHGVLGVGWGTSSDGDFWIVKNSWGATWGEKGYIRMARNKNNKCGIATMATLPHC